MMGPARQTARRLGVIGAVSVAMCALLTPAQASAPTDAAWLKFDTTAGEGTAITSLTNSGFGSPGTEQSIVTANPGVTFPTLAAATVAPSFTGSGTAIDYPDFDGTSTGPRAVVKVANSGAADVLNPGAEVFTFGADVRLDASNVGGTNDNGNNVIQRGLYGDRAQFKLEIDAMRAKCRVKGDTSEEGGSNLTSSAPIEAGTWYRIKCTRNVSAGGNWLTLKVIPIDAAGLLGTPIVRTSSMQPSGNTSFALSTPISIGGKLTSAGDVHSQTDQFNGLIDNAYLRIGS